MKIRRNKTRSFQSGDFLESLRVLNVTLLSHPISVENAFFVLITFLFLTKVIFLPMDSPLRHALRWKPVKNLPDVLPEMSNLPENTDLPSETRQEGGR